ncbi:MAG: patatin-like phospholipase family protein, partial [SAR324 cluster bacterium]
MRRVKKVRILSIDGGGIRGIIPARILEALEKRIGAPIGTRFEMIAGTSTGSILAASLAKPDPVAAADLVQLYLQRGTAIFSPPWWYTARTLGGLIHAKYPAARLEQELKSKLADTKLSEVQDVNLLVPAYRLQAMDPYFFKSWKARGIDLDSKKESAAQHDFRLRDVCRASSAAPTYFEPARIENGAGSETAYVDGGVFANNPAACAFASARRLYPNAKEFVIVSLGTGHYDKPIGYRTAKDWGLVGWARPIINLILDGSGETIDYQMQEAFRRPSRYFRFDIGLGDPAV